MNLLHDAYSAYLSGIAHMDAEGFIHWGSCRIKVLDAENEAYTIIDRLGVQCWCKNGNLHRDNGPAVMHADGTQHWYKNGNYMGTWAY